MHWRHTYLNNLFVPSYLFFSIFFIFFNNNFNYFSSVFLFVVVAVFYIIHCLSFSEVLIVFVHIVLIATYFETLICYLVFIFFLIVLFVCLFLLCRFSSLCVVPWHVLYSSTSFYYTISRYSFLHYQPHFVNDLSVFIMAFFSHFCCMLKADVLCLLMHVFPFNVVYNRTPTFYSVSLFLFSFWIS